MQQQESSGKNRLSDAVSPYLRKAADQPVHWYQWGEEAFKAAQQQDKPILLDIGAVWCHWCHVIDRESYSNPDIAKIINEHFIAIKVDRDQRPDIDARYQKAVQAISGQGGWPLTAFLTPHGDVFFGGTYFPPEEQFGRPGMKQLLPKVAEYYEKERDEVRQNVSEIREALMRADHSHQSGNLTPALLESLDQSILRSFDSDNGGFGNQPKFPSTPALEFATYRWQKEHTPKLENVVTTTLTAMAKGGIHDQLGGAFHRYSVDAEWHVPHFEVMSYVNSEMLRLYLSHYQITKNEYSREVAEKLIDYILAKGADSDPGGFYASQDADYSMEDDGDYWTWSVSEVDNVLNDSVAEVIKKYYEIQPHGDMRENPEKNVLRIASTPDEITKDLDMSHDQVSSLIAQGNQQLLEARSMRPEPFIDKSMYVDWNAMMARAFLEAGRVFSREDLTELATKTLDRIWNIGWNPEKGLVHRLGDTPGDSWGLLSDQAFYALSSLYAYEYTGNSIYLSHAQKCLDYSLQQLWDEETGGFNDKVIQEGEIGALEIPSQPIQDSPTPGENAIAALALQRFYLLTEDQQYQEKAEATLRRFAGSIGQYSTFASTFGLATAQLIQQPLHILVIGDLESELWKTALTEKYQLEILQIIDPKQTENIPEIAQPRVKNISSDQLPVALVCTATSCTTPIQDSAELIKRLKELRG